MKLKKLSKNCDIAQEVRKRGRPKKVVSQDVQKTEQYTKRQKSKHYIDADKFKELIKHYYKTDIFSEELGEMVNSLSHHVVYMPRFVNYTWHDQMISDANYRIIKALNERKYDPERGNAFSYFTKVCIRSFFHVTERERRNHTTIERYQDELYDEMHLHGYGTNATETENFNE